MMTLQQNAVFAAINLYAIQQCEGNPKDRIFTSVNAFLRGANITISEEEYDIIVKEFVDSDVVKLVDNIPQLSLTIERKPLKFVGRNADQQRGQFLGQSLFLRLTPLLTKAGKDFVIEFNVDGNGAKKLPDGSIVEESLDAVAKAAFNDHDVIVGDTSGVNCWEVCAEHHPEAPTKKTLRKLRNYLRYLDEAEPQRRDNIEW